VARLGPKARSRCSPKRDYDGCIRICFETDWSCVHRSCTLPSPDAPQVA
jgi:hypothetical protein